MQMHMISTRFGQTFRIMQSILQSDRDVVIAAPNQRQADFLLERMFNLLDQYTTYKVTIATDATRTIIIGAKRRIQFVDASAMLVGCRTGEIVREEDRG